MRENRGYTYRHECNYLKCNLSTKVIECNLCEGKFLHWKCQERRQHKEGSCMLEIMTSASSARHQTNLWPKIVLPRWYATIKSANIHHCRLNCVANTRWITSTICQIEAETAVGLTNEPNVKHCLECNSYTSEQWHQLQQLGIKHRLWRQWRWQCQWQRHQCIN